MKKIASFVMVFLLAYPLLLLCTCSNDTSDIQPTVHTVSLTPIGAAGSDNLTANVTEAAQGATVTLTATLGAGRRVALSAAGVTITPATISASGDTATFTMPGNPVALTATFSDIPPTLYGITVNQTGVAGSDNLTANVTEAAQGATVTLTATLGAGRRVALSADGVVITPATISASDDTATFTMPANAVVISATFRDIPSAGVIENLTVNTKSFNMSYVPGGGTFTMGEHLESTMQTVTLTKAFWMGETEVTQGLWEAIWGTTWPGNLTKVPSSTYGLGVSKPAYYVNWYDAVAFCNLLTVADGSVANTEQVYYSDESCTSAYTKADAVNSVTVYVNWAKKGYRLPTEAEWEYTARYIDGVNWIRGDQVSGGPVYSDETNPDKVGDYTWYSANNGVSGTPEYGSKDVGQKKANPLGLKDMGGNVWEWCYDWKGTYSGGSETDPTGSASVSYRVYRGGCWFYPALLTCCAYRNGSDPTTRHYSVGFRLCRNAD